MADLIIPAGKVLYVDGSVAIESEYELFRMGTNSKIVSRVDLTIVARRAEFGSGCVIDASGTPGATGKNGSGGDATNGAPGENGAPGGNGSNVTVQAMLAKVGGLKVVTNGGAGGAGGEGESPDISEPITRFGGGGGGGGQGGNAGRICIRWTPNASELAGLLRGAPIEHEYQSEGGPGGAGGLGGFGGPPYTQGYRSQSGPAGASGAGQPPVVEWVRGTGKVLWIQKQNMGPGPRADHAMVWEPARARVLMFGGGGIGATFPTSLHCDTWAWDGQFWIQLADTGPSARGGHGMSYDPVTGNVLLFGGRSGENTWWGDTWLWDGEAWIQVADSGPSPRENFAISTDPVRKRVVLFGGGTLPTGASVGDTWEWDGSEWVQRQDVGPSPRWGARMAYDPASQQTVLFGGFNGEFLADTWGWDGNAWQPLTHIGPPARARHAISHDGSGLVLFGGEGSPAFIPHGDTWTFRENRWRQVQHFGVSPRASAMAYDEHLGEIVLFGGTKPGNGEVQSTADTWQLRGWPFPAAGLNQA